MKNKKLILLLALLSTICFALIFNTFAHSGRTDANGGHWDRSSGTYHYHNKNIEDKARERAKIIDERYGEDAYGGSVWLDNALSDSTVGNETQEPTEADNSTTHNPTPKYIIGIAIFALIIFAVFRWA